jgi:tRNA pseudouridine(54/55) synthase
MVAGCSKCLALLHLQDTLPIPDDQGCPICLGSFSPGLVDKLKIAIGQAEQPYGRQNRFSLGVTPPTVSLPGDIVYRYAVAVAAAAVRNNAENDDPNNNKSLPPHAFAQEVKHHVREALMRVCSDRNQEVSMDEYPEFVRNEELGYLAVHVLFLPMNNTVPEIVRPPKRLFPKLVKTSSKRRNFVSQGGDPTVTFEKKLRRDGHALLSLKEATTVMEKDSNNNNIDSTTMESFQTPIPMPLGMDVHVVIWRRPFYLRGLYTKARRDVSQTPFHAADAGGKRRRIGVTSVEEEITPAIVTACEGISDRNNDPDLKNNLIFGMAKFHASGREDLNVRMMLPPDYSPNDKQTKEGEEEITGRPFVYEIFDANRLPRVSTLKQIVDDVNHVTLEDDPIVPFRTYGRNPMGVGISADLRFVQSGAFSGLQNETESKTKFYGCLCWSHKVLPETDEAITHLLGAFPLTIQQRTPIRVLHRRSNMVRERQVLSCKGHRVDDHYFRLHLSTSAGTYVKEFVHGDLGRTVPSISTLLGCTTDIMELDCEGIMM